MRWLHIVQSYKTCLFNFVDTEDENILSSGFVGND